MHLKHNWSSKRVPEAVSSTFDSVWTHYVGRSRAPTHVVERLSARGHIKEAIDHDHFAFRTFGVPGLGISSIGSALTKHGYHQKEYLTFPGKKLLATWFAPPQELYSYLPRVFVSELQVEKLSAESQEIILQHTEGVASSSSRDACEWIATAALPWEAPSRRDYEQLLHESEYAAWVLAHGYLLNHTALSIHRMHGMAGGIQQLVPLLEQLGASQGGLQLNSDGGVIKVSPDGGLLQSSTISDTVDYQFACGSTQAIAGPYIEFAERQVLVEALAGLPASQVQEWQRRDGFEVGNADKIFQSTRLAV